ncbi:MAG TPA: type I restriction-modification system subunit M N-terminal domain-containing protein [Candidatus Angelobacter sp.]|jgi:hypothetical protein
MARTSAYPTKHSTNLGLEKKLWQAADNLRGHMETVEYRRVIPVLIFPKYVSEMLKKSSTPCSTKGRSIGRPPRLTKTPILEADA